MVTSKAESRRHRLRDLPLKGGQAAVRRLVRDRRTRIRRGRTKRLQALLLALALLAYGASPLDLIPDTIPVIGWLDDLVVLPAGFWLVAWLLRRAQRERQAARGSAEGSASTRPDPVEARQQRLRTLLLMALGTLLSIGAGFFVQQFLPGTP